jgi:hypothetical protein
LPELGKYWLPEHPITDLLHPTPHPFAVGWLCLPLVVLSYKQATVVWLILQLACLAVSVVLLLRILGFEWHKRKVAFICFILLGWWPLILELVWAQLNLCLLLLFLIAWQALRQGKDSLGGILLGCLMLLKLAGWPIVLWLALQRRWRGFWAAGLFWAGAHLLAICLHGWGMVQDYYIKVGPQLDAIYRVRKLNNSMWTIGQRLFAEFGYNSNSAPPWELLLVKALTIFVPTLVLLLILRAAMQARNSDTAIVLLMGVGAYLNPIAWQHCLLLATPAMALLLSRLNVIHWPRRIFLVVISLMIALSIPQALYVHFAEWLVADANTVAQPIVTVLLVPLVLIPLIALLLLLWLLVRLELKEEPRVAGKNHAIDLALGEAEEKVCTAR